MNKRSQVTIFVIVAIIIVVGIIAYFVLRKPVTEGVPQNAKPVYDAYLSCLQDEAKQGISLMGEQAGWINPPEFVPGSGYMPFSSQLDFFGQPIPYWLYVSGNNVLKEQVPSRKMMEKQLQDYIASRVNLCNFDSFPVADVIIGENPKVSVSIQDTKVSVSIVNPFDIVFENESVSINEQKFDIDSKLGKFHQIALDIYNFEKTQMFLEKYAVDVMRLYAPVDGVELTCAPKFFDKQAIGFNITQGLAANVGMMKVKGSYYSLSSAKNSYFVTNIGREIDENVNFIYSNQWPTKIEIYGDDVAEPVGLQEGLGVLGFCYVPYHLVYDIDYPVMVQIFDNQEVFQFPVAVVIDKNSPRNAVQGEAGQSIDAKVCQYPDYQVRVNTYDTSLNPVEAKLKFTCLDSECSIGNTKLEGNEAVFNGGIPACVNGFIIAKASGYADGKYQISSNVETEANIVLNKLYSMPLDLGKVDSAIVYFKSQDYSTTVMYPDTKMVNLSEGYYNVSVMAFRNSSLVLPAVSQRKCVNVPQSGLGGMFGMTDEKCFNMEIPGQTVNYVLIGGGKTQEYLTENQLASAKKLNINVPLFKTPSSIQEVQNNYLELDNSTVFVETI